jgi:hypothetical protein
MSDQSGFDPPSGPPAGWYPDPYGAAGQRYWDGTEWDLTSPVSPSPQPGRDPDDLPEIGDWLDRSFRAAYGRWRALTVLALITAPASTALSYAAINRAVDGLVLEGDELYGWSSDRIPSVVALSLLAAFIGTIGSIAITVLMLRSVDDGPAANPRTFGDEMAAAMRSIIDAIRILPRVIGWFLVLIAGLAVVGTVIALLAVLGGGLAALLVLVLAPVGIWLAVKWAFVLIAIVDDRGSPFPRSSRVSEGRWWRTLGRLLLILIIVWLISMVVQTAASLVSGTGFGGFGGGTTITIDDDGTIERFDFDEELSFGTLEIVAAAIASMIATVAATSVMAAATAALYRSRNRRR